MEIGIQVSSLKPLLQTTEQVAASFEKMHQLGCHTVQLQWIDPAVPISDIAQILRDSGITSVSVQDFYTLILQDFSYYTELNSATGGTWMCVSRIPDHLKTPDGLDIFIEDLRSMQKNLDPMGQKLCFHPVSADFSAVPGMDALDIC